jgi:hypothetical protein
MAQYDVYQKPSSLGSAATPASLSTSRGSGTDLRGSGSGREFVLGFAQFGSSGGSHHPTSNNTIASSLSNGAIRPVRYQSIGLSVWRAIDTNRRPTNSSLWRNSTPSPKMASYVPLYPADERPLILDRLPSKNGIMLLTATSCNSQAERRQTQLLADRPTRPLCCRQRTRRSPRHICEVYRPTRFDLGPPIWVGSSDQYQGA